MRGALVSSWVLVLFVAAAGCGGGDTPEPGSAVPPGDDDDGGAQLCIDRDHDGYGRYCDQGKDCDDNDPTITDECRRCLAVTKDCPCAPGTTPQKCVPPTKKVDGGVLVCVEGTRYCRDGYWGDCETIGGYVFQPD